MRWIDKPRPPCGLKCHYCSKAGSFLHRKSYEHDGEVLSLYACPRCDSLIYDLSGVAMPGVHDTDVISPAAARAARYVMEAGFSSYYVAMCGLSAVPDAALGKLGEHLFVDIGAGMGMASYFAKTVVGIETLTVEPSFTGKLASEMLGLDVHRAYFEDLPEEVMAKLAKRACVLHLNMVVEHLVDPAAVLAGIMAKVQVDRMAIIVPDAAGLDFKGPFAAALPFLAPRDHRHLPTAQGLSLLLKRLGFTYDAVQRSSGLLIGIGACQPIAMPGERTIKFAEALLLEQMLRHPNPQVRAGGASRMLADATGKPDPNLMAVLRSHLPQPGQVADLTTALNRSAWDDIPYHLGPTCYYLGYDSFGRGQFGAALDYLAVTELFADKITEDHPEMAMTPLEFKWAALLLRATIEKHLADDPAARRSLQRIVDSRTDKLYGARQGYIDQAEAALRALQPALPARQPTRALAEAALVA